MFVEQRQYEVFAWLRANDPVHHDSRGFWALTRYADVSDAYLDHETFSSASGPMLGGSYMGAMTDSAANRMLVASDPPRHRLLRQLLHKVFGPEYVDRVARNVRTLVGRAVDRALADGGCDFATDIATELPAAALMAVMRLTHAQAHTLIGLTRQMIGFRDPNWIDTT